MLPAECVDDQLRAIVTRKHEALADAVFALFAQNNANQVQSAAVFYCDLIIRHHVLSPSRHRAHTEWCSLSSLSLTHYFTLGRHVQHHPRGAASECGESAERQHCRFTDVFVPRHAPSVVGFASASTRECI